MPRNSSGTYTLPAGNPVVTGTTISSTWANTTLADLATAMTDSLSRSGQGSMTAPLLLSDGAVGAPGLSWGNETTSGLYRAGAGDHRYSLSGTDKVQLTTNGLRTASGAVGTPSYSFISDSDTGLYNPSANQLNIACGGAQAVTITSTSLGAAGSVATGNGAVGTPAHTFTGDLDTGLYWISSNFLGVSAGGTFAGGFTLSGATTQFQGGDGINTIPFFSFAGNPNTGMYRPFANVVGFAANGVFSVGVGLPPNSNTTGIFLHGANSADLIWINSAAGLNAKTWDTFPENTGILHLRCLNDTISAATDWLAISRSGTTPGTATWGVTQHLSLDGSFAAPQYSFASDPDTGMCRFGANSLGLSVGNQNGLQLTNVGGGITDWVLGSGLSSASGFNVNTTTTASAGAQTLPANPQGFMAVTINGTNRKIPYYNP